MAKQAGRNFIYSFIKSDLEAANRHLRAAAECAFRDEDIDSAVEEFLKAISAIRSAEEHKAVSSGIVSTRQRNKFDEEIEYLRHCQWRLTKEICKETRSCYIQHEKTRVLRMQFLAYSYEPQEKEKLTEAELAGLH